jgi:hypothetical protein
LSPERRFDIGARAHARATALFELAQMQLKTLKVYDELLATDLAERFAQPQDPRLATDEEKGV